MSIARRGSVPFAVSVVAGAVSLLLAACASDQAEASPPVSPSVEPRPPAAASAAPTAFATPGQPGPGEWDTWSHDRKLTYMKSTVMPKMGAMLHDFDAKTFARQDCTVCHRAGAKSTTFKMPDVGLSALPSGPAEMKALAASEPAVFEFMVKTVVPATAALLGEQPYDPTTKTGFGCFGCHTKP